MIQEYIASNLLNLAGSIIISYLTSFFFIRKYILFTTSKAFFQPLRSDGPELHLKKKKNTPTMGGIFIVLSTLISVAIFADISNGYIKIISCVFVAFATIGLIDDLMKVIYQNSKGFRGSIKLVLQFIIICITYLQLGKINLMHHQNTIFFAINNGYSLQIANWIFILFVCFVIIGTANGSNLTDGLDGLLSVPAIFSLISLIILIYFASDITLANKIKVPYIDNSREIITFCTSLIGAILGFLTFNLKPAKIFMGDVGSLSIGAVLGLIAIIIKQEFIFLFIVFLFAIESLSVILQVASYKIYGKKIFLMAPIHHHFEKLGWSENKILYRFWLFSFVCCAVAITIYIL
jgi:phospho-N-acetylmuramoyl-pentapeptide-transferase